MQVSAPTFLVRRCYAVGSVRLQRPVATRVRAVRGRPAVECSEAHKTCPRPGDWGWAELIYDGAQITGPRVPRFRTARCSITTSSPKEGGLGLCNAVKRGQKTGAALADVAGEPGLSLKAIS